MEKEALVSEDEMFSRSGPKHLTDIDWTNQYHRTSVAASLVKGVYTLERDRQKKRIDTPESQAKDWWEKFHFSLKKQFIEERNGSIRAVIFEYKYKDTTSHQSGKLHPHYVVAFRGTILEEATWLRDLLIDFRFFTNLLHEETMRNIIDEVKTMVTRHGNKVIWLVGHSLGASMALFAGKTMARSGYPLETYLFNPATALTSLGFLKSKTLKFMGHLTRVSKDIMKGHDQGKEDDLFRRLAEWRPNLYVNPNDIICSEYINYFKDENKMSSEMSRYTKSNPFSSGGGETDASSEPLHILPSANLITNTTISPKRRWILKDLLGSNIFEKGFKAHQLRQWWDPDAVVVSELFQRS